MTRASAIRLHRMTAPGFNACVLEAGHGPTVLLLASPLVRVRSYRPLIRRLSRHFHLLAMELPGSGSASRLASPWNFEQHARWLAEFLATQRLRPLLVIGHSNSGAIALLLAGLAPHRLAGLVLTDTVGLPRPLFRLILGRAVDALLELGLSLRGWVDMVHNLLLHPRSFIEHVRLCASTDLSATARALRVPVLLAWGRHDHTEPVRFCRRWRRLIPSAREHISPTGSHDWLITHPGEFTAMLRSFANSVLTQTSPPARAAGYRDAGAPWPPIRT